MSDADSLGVLQDVFVLAGFSLALGLAVYAFLRMRTGLGWNNEGNVLSRPYDLPDLMIGLLLLGFFAWTGTMGKDPELDPANLPAANYAVGLVVNSFFFVFIVGLVLVYMGLYRGLNPAEMFGLRQMSVPKALGQAAIWLFAVALAMGAAIHVVTEFALGGKWMDDSPQEVVETFMKSHSIGIKLLLAGSAVLIAPLTEEIIFRGYLYGVVKHYSDRWFSAVFTSLVFAAVHQHVGSLFPLFLLAIGFSLAYEVTGCLLVPIFMHMLFNGFNVAMLLSQ